MISRHRLAGRDFALLARGQGNSHTTRVLVGAQRSRHAVLLRAVLDAAVVRPFEASAAGLAPAVRLLDAAQRKAPAEAAEVFGYPLVGAWASRCLRRLRHGGEDAVPLWVELGHLASIAAAAAVRARLDVEITVPFRAGAVVLPTLGQARVPTNATWGVATVLGDSDGGYRVDGQHGGVALPADPNDDGPGWCGLRRVALAHRGRRLTVYVDDLDPYRSGHELGPAGRLDRATQDHWAVLLAGAWTELVDRHPRRADELGARPLTVVPLTDRGTGAGANVTARTSVGAMALTPPPTALALAQSLVHEYQHSKLGALLDLVDLYDIDDRRRYYSPWRGDPRPLSGLLQGVYAFLAVTEFWLEYTEHPPSGVSTRLAWYEVARGREQVSSALETVSRSGSLTGVGGRFVAALRTRVEDLASVPIAADVVELAWLTNSDHRLAWRLRNVRIDQNAIAALVERWRRGAHPPVGGAGSRVPGHGRGASSRVVAADPPAYAPEPRHELARRVVTGRPAARAGVGTPAEADAALLTGDYAEAARRFLAMIHLEPDRPDAWSGLALARCRIGPASATPLYRDEPELVRALYLALRRDGVDPSPDAVATWLAG